MSRLRFLFALVTLGGGLAMNVDSVSAYEFPVHFTFTMWLAETAGFPEREAWEIAKFDQGTDEDPATEPSIYSIDPASVKRREDYHFPTARRLSQLQGLAQGCQRGRATPADFKRIGQYLRISVIVITQIAPS